MKKQILRERLSGFKTISDAIFTSARQVGEKSESSASAQPSVQPAEGRVAHQSPAHGVLPPCGARVPIQPTVRRRAPGGSEPAATLRHRCGDGSENNLHRCRGTTFTKTLTDEFFREASGVTMVIKKFHTYGKTLKCDRKNTVRNVVYIFTLRSFVL